MTEEFTLEKLRVIHKKRIIFDVNFIEEDRDFRNRLLSTVIIGVNGSGKSYLLTVIAEIFRALRIKRQGKDYSLKYDSYYIKYSLNNSKYEVKINRNIITAFREKKQVNMDQVIFPNKILAVAYMVNDKFVFKAPDSNSEDGYEYLGIRQASNAAWTTSIGRRVCDALIKQSVDSERNIKVKEILEFLGFEARVNIVYESNTKTLFKKRLALRTLAGRIKKFSKSDDLRSTTVKRDKETDGLLNFVNNISQQRTLININERRALKYTLDFGESINEGISLANDYYQLRRLVDLKLINTPKLILYKQEQEFDFEYASSGEKHLLLTLFNISSKIVSNSIVLIDEPELSLHPNWQMRYINYLKKLFVEFYSCHFLFATHSHYIVSDLERESSSLVTLSATYENNIDRVAELIKYDTYAWSAENILYNIFQVRTTRNYYFEMDLRKLIEMIRKKDQDFEVISGLVNKIGKYSYDANDPLNLIILEAKRYIENGHSKKIRE